MRAWTCTLVLGYLAALSAAEAPQEHSHEKILLAANAMLKLDNPLGIEDAVFGLIGDTTARAGAGTVTNIKCLQQNIADQAFTNAKAAGNVDGMAAAIMYRALERNTTPVGGASELCDETAVNPEIDAISQHQDPASAEAAAGINRQIALNVAVQLHAIGADPNQAILTGTFPAGQIGDPTGDGFICDDMTDLTGCIYTTGMLVADVTEAEIAAHLAGETVDIGAVVVAAAAAEDRGQLATLARAVNISKIANDTQGEANLKGAIWALGAKAAAAHPNAAAAARLSADAFAAVNGPGRAAGSADTIVGAAGQPLFQTVCLSAVRTTNQISIDELEVPVDETVAVPACIEFLEINLVNQTHLPDPN